MINPYSAGKKSGNLYSRSTDPQSEVDLREEMDELLTTAEKKGAWMLYRRVRLDDKGMPVKHPDTFLNRSGEIPRDVLSQGSTNNGYLYDDYVVQGFLNHSQAYSMYNKYKKAGESLVDYRTVYFKWDFLNKAMNKEDQIPNVLDKVIRLKQDMAGNLTSPSEVIERYDILSVDPYRLDNYGRVEYHRIRVISVIDESFQI